MKTENLVEERSINGGIQKIFRFDNGFGASVVKHSFSYGSMNGKWELAVIKFNSSDNFDFQLRYDTSITSDVLGHLSDDDVNEVLGDISKLN